MPADHKFVTKYALTSEEREGLTTAQAEAYQNAPLPDGGFNELPVITVSKWKILFLQFTGTMPYMLEVAFVIAACVEDWKDVGIIGAMLLANGFLGFKEELECLEALEALTQNMETKVTVQRDGLGQSLNTRLLVPGDIIMLLGGLQVPADVDWCEGDQLMVNTAALTGEGIDRKYPSDEYGSFIQCGCTVSSGEAYGIVRKIGMQTEIGSTAAEIQKDKAKGKVLSVFEDRVLSAVTIIIIVACVITLCIFLVQGIKYHEFNKTYYKKDLLTCLSIVIAAIPIALPIVLNVTMSLGAAKMATHYSAVVTNIPALQDIASMSVLCSDKTGTLTTAKMTINPDMVWCNENQTPKDVALFAMLASSRDKKEDAVDRTVVKYFDKLFGSNALAMTADYTKIGGMGFNPIYKRVTVDLTHPKLGKLKIAKGLATKVVDTSDGGVDDAEEQWKCRDHEKIMAQVKVEDKRLSSSGYKTLGVAVKIGEKPWEFCGILPMMDPPRADSAETVRKLGTAGIKVKMITGDHLNIAIETSRQIGMGKRIFPGSDVRQGSMASKQNILEADGFAQVLPSDKREVVEVLKRHHGLVVGMTGDGVNDAPALSAAQCGVAVDDATDAAKNAAAIILMSPGLSAIYYGVVESRRIFRKLKSYVVYRFAASIQIVAVLTVLVFASNCAIDPTYIILLALFNDLTMLPISYDAQSASSKPENPDVNKLLLTSFVLGMCETFCSLLFAYAAGPSQMFNSPVNINQCYNNEINPDNAPATSKSIQGAIWLQMFIAAEILIFSARAPSWFNLFLAPSNYLIVSVLGGCIIASGMSMISFFGALKSSDIALIWIYDILCLIVIDAIKVKLFQFMGEHTETLPDEAYVPCVEEAEDDEELNAMNEGLADADKMTTRQSAAANRMTQDSINMNERLSHMDPNAARQSLLSGRKNSGKGSVHSPADIGRVSLSGRAGVSGAGFDTVRGSLVSTSGSLRPNTPAVRNAGH